MRVLFVGSGPSVSLPILSCIRDTCQCCQLARKDPASKNNRFNTSILLSKDDKHVLIDCGKTFYAAARSHIYQRPSNGSIVTKLDAVIITHGHADAIGGIDDLRHYTRNRSPTDGPLTVHCDADTMSVISATFPYLVDTKTATGSGEVAQLLFDSTLRPHDGRLIAGFAIIPVPVEHGVKPDQSPYQCLSFIIDKRIVFMSDVSRLPDEALLFIKTMAPVVDLLILDCLFDDRNMQSHIGWPGARHIISLINPKQTLLVGMDHCIEHDLFNGRLDEETGGRVQLAYDGMIVDC